MNRPAVATANLHLGMLRIVPLPGRAHVLIVLTDMTEKTPTTVEMSLEALSHALSRAADDLRAAVPTIDRAREEIESRNTSISREVVRDAERVLDHLRHADESLRDVVTDLANRD